MQREPIEVRKLMRRKCMTNKVPEPKGYDGKGNCSKCHSSDSAMSSPYKNPDTGEQIQDIYCEDCGTVLDVMKKES